MKKIFYMLLPTALFLGFVNGAYAQTSTLNEPEAVIAPWTNKELIEPAVLAAKLTGDHDHAVIFNIGKVEDIKGATHIGPVSKAENLDKLKAEVASLPKNTELIIYCGCCPFAKCPNIRPAFTTLKKMGFTNIKVLDIPVNLETNWTSKGYPLAGK
ncbi:MAG: rhodanese-like domain-containing protein [Mucilaginibacter sp.]